MEQILESYLVALGFKPDEASFRKFEAMLARADSAVDNHTGGMLKAVLKAQTGIIGAFTTMSGAAVGLVDKVAMADQGYRLFGLRMLATAETGRKLKMITEGLGASLEEIIWDQELHQRAVVMSADIDRLTKQLGPDFEKNMKGIRDIRFQFTELGLVFQGAEMEFASKLFESMGINIQTLHQWVEKLAAAAPGFADRLATGMVPVLRETVVMLKAIADVGAGAATVFTNLIGVLSGDTAIVGTTFNFEKLAKAMEHVLSLAARVFHAIASAEGFVSHILSGDLSGAFKALTPGGGAVGGALAGAAYGSFFGPLGTAVGGVIGGTGGYFYGKASQAIMNGDSSGSGAGVYSSRTAFDSIADAITKQEGFYPGSVAYRNNNPGNMVYAGQAGAYPGGAGGFAKFTDAAAGRAAIISQLRLDAARGLTLGQEIEKWAPRSDRRNNTDAYIANVAARTGLSPSTRLSDIQMTVRGGDVYVQGTSATPAQIRKAAADGTQDGAARLADSQRQWVQAQLAPA